MNQFPKRPALSKRRRSLLLARAGGSTAIIDSLDAGLALIDQAVGLAEESGDPAALADVVMVRGGVLYNFARGDGCIREMSRARPIAIALNRLRTESNGKVEILPLPIPVLRDLKRMAADVVREQSEKTPMARKVHASFTKFQAVVGPWDHVAEGAYHQLVS